MSGPKQSVFLITLIIQCLLVLSIFLPGLGVHTKGDHLEGPLTADSVTSDRIFSTFTNPAALIDFLRFVERRDNAKFTLRTTKGDILYRSPPDTKHDSKGDWLAATLEPVAHANATDSSSIFYQLGELTGWSLEQKLNDTTPDLRLTIEVTPQTLMLTMAVIFLMALFASRWIARPIQHLERQILAIQHRRDQEIRMPNGNITDLNKLTKSIACYVEDQRETRIRAGYGSALLNQVILNLDTPIMILDEKGVLRFSNPAGRRAFRLGTHPNAWTHLSFAKTEAVQELLKLSADEHRPLFVRDQDALPSSTVIQAITRGNEERWMLFTVSKRETDETLDRSRHVLTGDRDEKATTEQKNTIDGMRRPINAIN